MSNPPPWNDPIKPPNGNFTLEERKWREGITRGLNNIKIKSLGDIGDVDLTSPSANEILKFDGSNWVNGSPSTSVTNWGDILGTLSNQTDLQNALNDKQDVIDANNKLDYSLLSNTPTIPTVNNATLTLNQNGSLKGTFTANASSAVSIDFTDTNTTSGITVNSNVVPDDDGAYLLGDTLHYWSWIYANRISVSNVVDSVNGIRFGSSVNCAIQPWDSETGLIFRTRTTDNTGYKYIVMDNEDFYPSTGNSTDLGKNGRWRTIYTNNAVNVSDVRAKDNIEDLENALEKINSIGVKSYTLNNHDEGIMYGFIAQDELERNPELVVVPEDYSEEEGGGELMYMPNNVLFLAVKAIQELSAKVTALENKLESLGV